MTLGYERSLPPRIGYFASDGQKTLIAGSIVIDILAKALVVIIQIHILIEFVSVRLRKASLSSCRLLPG
jgi:hypothetical protein